MGPRPTVLPLDDPGIGVRAQTPEVWLANRYEGNLELWVSIALPPERFWSRYDPAVWIRNG